MKHRMFVIATVVAGLLSMNQGEAQTPKLTPPPQDAGLPYTRSARPI